MYGLELGPIWVGFGVNLLLASLFATWVRHGSAHGYTDGKTAALVVIGCSFTLLVNQFWLYVPDDVVLDGILEFSGFASAGTPMVLEYFYRRAMIRRQEEARGNV